MTQKFTVNTPSYLLIAGLALAVGVSCSSKDDDPEEITAKEKECTEDDHGEPESAVALTTEPSSGFVCPIEDQDWYSVSIPEGDQLVSIQLGVSVALSPVQITYALFSVDGSGAPVMAVAQPPPGLVKPGAALNLSHCVPAGDYLMVVRDQGDDQADTRNPYSLSVSSQPDPDPGEPNADQGTATAITSGSTQNGSVACRGDEDFYKITVPADNRITVSLTSPVATYEPKVQVLAPDGSLLRAEENPRGPQDPTDISFSQVLPGAGEYYIVVSDNDNEHADPNVPYALTVDTVLDIDPNEPNDHPDEATPLAGGNPVACGANWSQGFTSTGTIGSEGDDDWFQIDLSGCNPGVIEASVEFDTGGLNAQEQWDFNQEIQASVTIVRPHVASACANDLDCTTLVQTCEGALDCAGYGENCLAGQELCAGAVVCLPTGVGSGHCGANQMQRSYGCPARNAECQPGNGAPPANQAKLAAPILNHNVLWVRVTDFQGNGAAPDRSYTLNVRVRGEPDTNEPSNLPIGLISPAYERSDLSAGAKPITVRDCTMGDCCNGSNGTNGVISYDGDVDWYRYANPCAVGTDCTLRMVWSTEAGPTDIGINVYRSNGGSWLPGRETTQRDLQSADSGNTGGVAGANACFYGYRDHDNYLVEVRDTYALFSDEVSIRPDSRDWSADQGYSFCIEKVSNVCEEPPCMVYPDGCGPPQ